MNINKMKHTILTLILILSLTSYSQEIKKERIKTPHVYKSITGTYQVYKNSKGGYYIVKISKRTGKELIQPVTIQ